MRPTSSSDSSSFINNLEVSSDTPLINLPHIIRKENSEEVNKNPIQKQQLLRFESISEEDFKEDDKITQKEEVLMVEDNDEEIDIENSSEINNNNFKANLTNSKGSDKSKYKIDSNALYFLENLNQIEGLSLIRHFCETLKRELNYGKKQI